MARDALGRAIRALASADEQLVRSLNLREAAWLLSTLPPDPRLAPLRTKLATRLRSHLATDLIIHGNLYEVFACLTALWQYDRTLITGDELAAAIQRLVQAEADAGGPYYTDGKLGTAANAQIALFVQLVAKPLPHVTAFLDHIITTWQFEDDELQPGSLLYLLGQAAPSAALAKRVAKQWQRPAAQQLPTGFWEGEPIFKTSTNPAVQQLLTTATIAAVLSARRNLAATPAQDTVRCHAVIAQEAQRLFARLHEPLRSDALKLANQVCQADKNFEITLFAWLFTESLAQPRPLSDAQYTTLGLASLCGWMAYTIYDDFLDCEGQPAQLPIANVALRATVECFRQAVPDDPRFQRYVADVLDGVDEANAWEVRHCRFAIGEGQLKITGLPRYGDASVLAQRSFGHALGPLAVVKAQPLTQPKVQTQAIETAFRHYLIARQLNDDLQDWLDDIHAGQASYVVTAILHHLQVKPGTYQLAHLLPRMQKCFRECTMPAVCQTILHHIAQSREAFAASQLLKQEHLMSSLLNKLERSVRLCLDKRAKTQAFYASADKFETTN